MNIILNKLNESATTLLPYIIELLTLVAIIYITRLINKVKVEANKIQNEDERKLLMDSLEDVRRTLVKNMVRVNETSKQAILKSNNGNLTEEDKKKLLTEAIESTKNQISNDVLNMISRRYDDVNGYLEATLEHELRNMKLEEVGQVNSKEYEDALKEIEELKKELAKEQNK